MRDWDEQERGGVRSEGCLLPFAIRDAELLRVGNCLPISAF